MIGCDVTTFGDHDFDLGRAAAESIALAYNLRRVLNLVGFAELMAAVAA
jgi:hypothetical protein